MGVASIADKPQRRNRDGSGRAAARTAKQPSGETSATSTHTTHEAPAADASLPAGTLFAATMLSSGMATNDAALTELRIRRNRDWTPPESILRLRDKTI
jgi:hypothetical protein